MSDFGHYKKGVEHLVFVDVYRVLELYDVRSHAVGHAIKKLLCSGQRGVKSYEQDLIEAKASIERELQMIAEDENKRLTVQNEQLVRDLHRIDSARQ